MLEWLFRFFMGWCEITVEKDCRSAFVAMLWEREIPFWRERIQKETMTVRIAKGDRERCQTEAQNRCLSLFCSAKGGLPVVLAICRRRPGLIAGGLFCLFWCLWSAGMVWDVEVDGLETMTVARIEEILSSYGCGIGDRYGRVDFDLLHARVRADHPEIAWLSVYMNGTTAEVQLREKKVGASHTHPAGTYANVVAAEAGEILSVRVFEGQAVVEAGQVVLPGEMLVSGVVPMKEEGESRLEYAAGEVLARVMRPIQIEILPEREKITYTGREKTKKSVKFFKKTINLFGNTGNSYATCDTIDTIEEVCLFGLYEIPVAICSTAYRETQTVMETLTPSEMEAEGARRLREETDAARGTGEMLSRIVSTGFDGDGVYRIHCLLYLEKDISTTAEFTVSENVPTEPGNTN